MVLTSPIDMSRASVRHDADGSVVFADAGPWSVRVWVTFDEGRARIARMQVDAVDPSVRVTAGRLAALPVRNLLHIAIREAVDDGLPGVGYPNEGFIRLLARPKTRGCRQWDDDHYDRVLRVFDWAKAVGYAGGPYRAVSDMWGIAVDPTAARWLAEARRRQRARG